MIWFTWIRSDCSGTLPCRRRWSRESFSDHWTSFDDYIDWYAEVINNAFAKLNKNGWLYAHNNFIGNALVLSKVDRKVRDAFYTNISWKRSGPKNNIKNGWGNIVDSIMVLRKGNPYFEVEYTSLDPVYAANSFKNKTVLDIMLSPKLLVKRVVLVQGLNMKLN